MESYSVENNSKIPHLHRLKPYYNQRDNFKITSANQFRGGKPLIGTAAVQEITAIDTEPLFFYFDDKGSLYVGVNEQSIQLVKGTFDKPPEIHWSDLESTFRLGMAVAHLQHKLSDCEPVALSFLHNDRKIHSNYD